jgi:mono/diheme cytochrome c family protein
MQTTLRYLSLGLNTFLLILYFFKEKLDLPDFLLQSGKLHPLLLHIPIGAMVLFLLFYFLLKKQFNTDQLKTIFGIVTISASLTALFGFFLGQEGYEEGQLNTHRNTGLLLSILSYLVYEFFDFLSSQKAIVSNLSLGFLGIFMAWVGHSGGSITHGEDFLSFSQSDPESNEVSTLYAAKIEPIFKQKCVQCHNDAKTKGNLNMSSVAKMLKGGKHGLMWKAGSTAQSLFLQRALLPLEHKEHMPPKGKNQLSPEELEILTAWVKEGASTQLKLTDISEKSFFKDAKQSLSKAKTYHFKAVSESELDKIRSPFLSLVPVATGSAALKANFFVKSAFKSSDLDKLESISENLISLDLSKMPVKDDIFTKVLKFENLENLILNQTQISGVGIEKLSGLKNLSSLSISNTPVSEKQLELLLNQTKNLKVYAWSTQVSNLKMKNGNRLELGFVPSNTEQLKITEPKLLNELQWFNGSTDVAFSHTLKGVEIRYALDEEPLDSVHFKVYKSPIKINKNTNIKVMAFKEGWKKSNINQYQFFKSGVNAKSMVYNTPVDRFYGVKLDGSHIDLLLGDVKNFRDPRWVVYNDSPLEQTFLFEKGKSPSGLTLSYLSHSYENTFPPQYIEIYVKTVGSSDFKLVKREIPAKMKEKEVRRYIFEYHLTHTNIESIKIKAKALNQPPAHLGFKPNGYALFISDEVFFY